MALSRRLKGVLLIAGISLALVGLGMAAFSGFTPEDIEHSENTTDIEENDSENLSSNREEPVEKNESNSTNRENKSDIYYENMIEANVLLDYRGLNKIDAYTEEVEDEKVMFLNYSVGTTEQINDLDDIEFITDKFLEAVDQGWNISSMKANVKYRNATVGNWTVKKEWLEEYRNGSMNADEVRESAAATVERIENNTSFY